MAGIHCDSLPHSLVLSQKISMCSMCFIVFFSHIELFNSFFALKSLMNVFIPKLAFKNVKCVTSGPVHLYFDLCKTVDSVTHSIIKS